MKEELKSEEESFTDGVRNESLTSELTLRIEPMKILRSSLLMSFFVFASESTLPICTAHYAAGGERR